MRVTGRHNRLVAKLSMDSVTFSQNTAERRPTSRWLTAKRFFNTYQRSQIMANRSPSVNRKKILQLVFLAYRCASGGASSDTVLCNDAKRAKFDSYVQTLGDVYGVSITPEEGRRRLLGLRKAGVLGRSVNK